MALVAMIKRERWLWLLWSRGEGGFGCYGQEVRVALVAMIKRERWLWLLWSRGEGGFGCYGQEVRVALVAMVKRERWLWLLWSRGEGGFGGYGQEGWHCLPALGALVLFVSRIHILYFSQMRHLFALRLYGNANSIYDDKNFFCTLVCLFFSIGQLGLLPLQVTRIQYFDHNCVCVC